MYLILILFPFQLMKQLLRYFLFIHKLSFRAVSYLRSLREEQEISWGPWGFGSWLYTAVF
jgi:hypothetical protein